jgi:hypothetical protein
MQQHKELVDIHSFCILYHVARMGDRRGTYRVLAGRPKGKRRLGRCRRSWDDNIKMGMKEEGWGGTDRIDLVQDRDRSRVLMNAVLNLWFQ